MVKLTFTLCCFVVSSAISYRLSPQTGGNLLNEGILEVRVNDIWGYACGAHVGQDHAQLACQRLGKHMDILSNRIKCEIWYFYKKIYMFFLR